MKNDGLKLFAAIILAVCALAGRSGAAELNLATLSCDKYENEVLPAAATNPTIDSLNTVMWLMGYAVAKSGQHVLYPEALSPFGFALDDECKSNPRETLLEALAIVKPQPKNPMDLSSLPCATFAQRHVDLARGDPDSATTIMMWLFGFSVAKSGSHLFDTDALGAFESALLADCAKHPQTNLLDALAAVKTVKPAK
jgi:hypothetical protein